MRPILLVGGSPRVPVDAVRYLVVHDTGTTALRLRELLADDGCVADLFLGVDAAPGAVADRFSDRAGLEAGLRRWIGAHADGVVVMSAAINDYQVESVEVVRDGTVSNLPRRAKAPSNGDELVIRLHPAAKVIDQLRGWGMSGPVVGFKYEEAETVIDAAGALLRRVGAALVVANSLCGTVLALVDQQGIHRMETREKLYQSLAKRLVQLARG
jgi:hypothetical protein